MINCDGLVKIYEKVEIRDNGIAVVTGITGKTQTIKL